MPYLQDLSPTPGYPRPDPSGSTLAVGWLGPDDDFSRRTDPLDEAFADALAAACDSHLVQLMRGYHWCDFCKPTAPDTETLDDGRARGNGEVRVVASDGSVLAAPALVHHYVVAHDYQPPPEFIDAVLAGRWITETGRLGTPGPPGEQV